MLFLCFYAYRGVQHFVILYFFVFVDQVVISVSISSINDALFVFHQLFVEWIMSY